MTAPHEDPENYVTVEGEDSGVWEIVCTMHGSLGIAPDLADATEARHDHENRHGLFADDEGAIYYDSDEDEYR